MIKIVILDSGLRSDMQSNVKGVSLIGQIISHKYEDDCGHGTAVYGIIQKIKNIAEIYIIKIYGDNYEININDLIFGLNYIYENINADIINMSLGVSILEKKDRLYNICRKLSDKGCILISAFDNTGSISYPAAFDNVIGVTSGINVNRIDEFEYFEDNNTINIAAKGNVQKVWWTTPKYIFLGGNSFACAHVTVKVAKLMHEGFISKDVILEKIKEESIKIHKHSKNEIMKQPFLISKAALFPFNKEMHSLIRYQNLLSFSIVDIYDVKYSPQIGKSTSELLNLNNKTNTTDFQVKSIEQIQWEKFDTIILGHMDELSLLIKQSDLKLNIIKQCLDLKKKIYLFDQKGIPKSILKKDDVYCSMININNVCYDNYGKLFRISKPVLGVFGTSSKQGKFTLQLKLRELLLQAGYNVGQIGTEPSSLLYGIDYCFPFGHNSSVSISGVESIKYLNSIINELCEKNDIIIVGSQSGTIPYDYGNIIQFPMAQYDFLMGCQPDRVILCVNPYDEINYIFRTILFIESSVDCKVIAVVVFPKTIKDDWTGIYGGKQMLSKKQYNMICEELFNKLNIPVFKLGDDSDMQILTDLVIDSF